MNRIITAAIAACMLTACRDAPDTFTPTEVPAASGSPRQLTFSTGADMNPTWSANSDTVYYTALNFVDYPATPVTVLRIGTAGGLASLLLPGAQPNGSGSLVLPVPSPTRDRFAYVQIAPMLKPEICAQNISPPPCPSEPLIQSGFLRVRAANAVANATLDPGVAIPFQGVDPARSSGGAPTYEQRLFPYQLAFNTTTELEFRPTWSPDASHIAYSDGLSVRLWDMQSTTAPVIPNTDGGVSPSWSPAGNQIAFARQIRGDSVRSVCSCHEPGANPQSVFRWVYTVTDNVITLINSDGTGAVALAHGTEPAWSPDGSMVYYIRDFQVYRIPRAGGTEVSVPGTIGAYSVSISPDGKWLAFARPTVGDSDPNIWLLSLSAQQ